MFKLGKRVERWSERYRNFYEVSESTARLISHWTPFNITKRQKCHESLFMWLLAVSEPQNKLPGCLLTTVHATKKSNDTIVTKQFWKQFSAPFRIDHCSSLLKACIFYIRVYYSRGFTPYTFHG